MADILTTDPAMPTNPRPSPIYNLDFDILWTIFWTNANLHWRSRQVTDAEWASRPRPLDVLRHTSQVCRQWREITLGSPSLWGMVIELDLLGPKKECWQKEVMGRAGQSHLFVSGVLDGSDTDFRLFFVKLLGTSWARVRRLDITVTHGFRFEPQTWEVLLRPSPELEIFKLLNRGGARGNITTLLPIRAHPSPPIFSDIAPALREFNIDNAPRGWFSLQAPWLSQLRSLAISSSFNATEVLAALTNIPALEYLELKDILTPISDPHTHLSLPLLRKLTISKHLRTSLFFLKWITPPAGVSLDLCIRDYNVLNSQEIHFLCKEIRQYSESYFNWAPFAKSLALEFSQLIFAFRGRKSNDEAEPIPSHSDFCVSIFGARSHSTRLPDLATFKLLASITACRFTHITRFEFLPSGTMHDLHQVQPTLMALFSALPSVELLVTSAHGLDVLLDSHDQTPPSDTLPLLKTLWLKVGDKMAPHSRSILSFLKWRTRVGRPITTFDVSDSILSEDWLDWTYLDEIDGLKIILRRDGNGIEEYICGTGTPERLQLRQGF